MSKTKKMSNRIWSGILTILALLYVYPVVMIFYNSLKQETAITTDGAFQLPTAQTFAGLANYVNAIESKGFLQSLWYSLVITITSVAAILICCSMCAWFITRVKNKIAQALYFLFVFSMVVPFQMVMFTLSQTADGLKLNTPYNIWIIYLGFGAGLAVFMFAGFMKSVPLEVEEASMIDGCNPIQTFFRIVLPMLRPTLVSVGILEAMWVWNDYLLPSLVINQENLHTIPLRLYYFFAEYTKEWNYAMAGLVLSTAPVIVFYLFCQKYIIKGISDGAIKQ